MVKLSKEEKDRQSQAEQHKSKFTTMFSTEHLREIYDNEILLIPNWELISKMLLKEVDLKDEHFINYIPKSIKYVKENIFHSANGEYYMSSYCPQNGFYAKEYTKEVLANTYINFFPQMLKKWFSVYSKVYQITCNQAKPRVFEENKISYLNMFSGFPLDGVARDAVIIEQQKENVAHFWSHLKENLCSDNTPVFEELKRWICALVGGRRKMKTAPYMKGVKGSGKGILMNLLESILGKQNVLRINNANDILGNFNGHLAGKLLVILDDMHLAYTQFCQLYQTLKTYITEDTNAYRDLFKRMVNLANICSFILIANQDMLKLEANGGEERRFYFLDVNPQLREMSYYVNLATLIEGVDFQKAFLWDCQDNYDPQYKEGVEIKKLPITDSQISSSQHSITPAIDFFKALCAGTEGDFNMPRRPKHLYELYVQFYMESNKYKKERVPLFTIFINEIKNFSFVKEKKNMRYKGSHPLTHFVLDHQKCIKEFQKKGFLSAYEIEELNLKTNTDEELLEKEMQRMKELRMEINLSTKSFMNLTEKIMGNKQAQEEKNKPIFQVCTVGDMIDPELIPKILLKKKKREEAKVEEKPIVPEVAPELVPKLLIKKKKREGVQVEEKPTVPEEAPELLVPKVSKQLGFVPKPKDELATLMTLDIFN